MDDQIGQYFSAVSAVASKLSGAVSSLRRVIRSNDAGVFVANDENVRLIQNIVKKLRTLANAIDERRALAESVSPILADLRLVGDLFTRVDPNKSKRAQSNIEEARDDAVMLLRSVESRRRRLLVLIAKYESIEPLSRPLREQASAMRSDFQLILFTPETYKRSNLVDDGDNVFRSFAESERKKLSVDEREGQAPEFVQRMAPVGEFLARVGTTAVTSMDLPFAVRSNKEVPKLVALVDDVLGTMQKEDGTGVRATSLLQMRTLVYMFEQYTKLRERLPKLRKALVPLIRRARTAQEVAAAQQQGTAEERRARANRAVRDALRPWAKDMLNVNFDSMSVFHGLRVYVRDTRNNVGGVFNKDVDKDVLLDFANKISGDEQQTEPEFSYNEVGTAFLTYLLALRAMLNYYAEFRAGSIPNGFEYMQNATRKMRMALAFFGQFVYDAEPVDTEALHYASFVEALALLEPENVRVSRSALDASYAELDELFAHVENQSFSFAERFIFFDRTSEENTATLERLFRFFVSGRNRIYKNELVMRSADDIEQARRDYARLVRSVESDRRNSDAKRFSAAGTFDAHFDRAVAALAPLPEAPFDAIHAILVQSANPSSHAWHELHIANAALARAKIAALEQHNIFACMLSNSKVFVASEACLNDIMSRFSF